MWKLAGDKNKHKHFKKELVLPLLCFCLRLFNVVTSIPIKIRQNGVCHPVLFILLCLSSYYAYYTYAYLTSVNQVLKDQRASP